MKFNTEVLVIGGGPAGMAAALTASEHAGNVMLIERDDRLGGILNQCIHSGFGLSYFKQELTGPEYANRFAERVGRSRIQVLKETMVLSITEKREVTAVNQSGVVTIRAGAIVLAMGCRERTRGNIAIPGSRPAGVMTAGAAQRYMNVENLCPGRKAVILGSGDIGLIMARRLVLEGIEVEGVYEVMPYANGLARNIRQCLEDFNIPLYLSTTVVDIHGENRLTGVTVAEVDDLRREIEGTRRRIDCDLLLLSVGLIPENELSAGAGIRLGKLNGPVVNERLETSAEGIFACGNVLHVHDEADCVTREAERAGKNAALYAIGRRKRSPEQDYRRIFPGTNVSYTVPGVLTKENKEPVEIFFRAKRPVLQGRVVVRAGEKELFAGKRGQVFRPGNMCAVQIMPEWAAEFTEDVRIDIEEDAQ